MIGVGIIIAICVAGAFVLALAGAAWFMNLKRAKKRSYPALEKRAGSCTLSGNLVQEFKQPITDFYTMVPIVLGRGSSADVVVGEHTKQKRRYAIKMVDTSRKEVVWRYDREKNFLKDVEHTNIGRLYEVYTAPTAMFFVMELCTGGHLGHRLKLEDSLYLEEDVVRRYIQQILGAVIHCHSRGLCHRDIKLQNILLENNSARAQAKLVDFGNAVRFVGKVPLVKVVGTTYTAAPEIFLKSYDERCDVWSLGVVAFILLSGKRPFERPQVVPLGQTRESAVINSIVQGHFDFSARRWQHVSDEGVDFVKCCMHMDYKSRSSALELLDHPWLVYAPSSPSASPSISKKDRVVLMSKSTSDLSQLSAVSATTLSSQGSDMLKKVFAKTSAQSERERSLVKARLCFMLPVAFSMAMGRVESIREIFQEIDRNGNGLIEKDEFRVVAAQVQGDFDYSAAEIDQVFDVLDQDQSGSVGYLAFLAAAVLCQGTYDVLDLEQGFRLLDRQRKGHLNKDDLWCVLHTVSAEEQQAGSQRKGKGAEAKRERDQRATARSAVVNLRVADIIRVTDFNHDNVVSYSEFLFALSPSEYGLTGGGPDSLVSAPAQDAASKRRQSDGNVRLEGSSFGTRQRLSFMRPPVAPPQRAQDKVDRPRDPWRGVPSLRQASSSFLCFGRGQRGDLSQGNEVFHQVQALTKDMQAVSFVEDLSVEPGYRWQSSTSLFAPGDAGAGPGSEPKLSSKHASSASLLESQPRGSLVRRISSAIFDSAPSRARARTSPALLFSVKLQDNTLTFVPNPEARAPPNPAVNYRSRASSHVSSRASSAGRLSSRPSGSAVGELMDHPRAPPGLTAHDDDDERVWNESDDSLDRSSFRYIAPEGDAQQQHLLEGLRQKSLGRSLDSQLFRQQLLGSSARAVPSHASGKVHPIEAAHGEQDGLEDVDDDPPPDHPV